MTQHNVVWWSCAKCGLTCRTCTMTCTAEGKQFNAQMTAFHSCSSFSEWVQKIVTISKGASMPLKAFKTILHVWEFISHTVCNFSNHRVWLWLSCCTHLDVTVHFCLHVFLARQDASWHSRETWHASHFTVEISDVMKNLLGKSVNWTIRKFAQVSRMFSACCLFKSAIKRQKTCVFEFRAPCWQHKMHFWQSVQHVTKVHFQKKSLKSHSSSMSPSGWSFCNPLWNAWNDSLLKKTSSNDHSANAEIFVSKDSPLISSPWMSLNSHNWNCCLNNPSSWGQSSNWKVSVLDCHGHDKQAATMRIKQNAWMQRKGDAIVEGWLQTNWCQLGQERSQTMTSTGVVFAIVLTRVEEWQLTKQKPQGSSPCQWPLWCGKSKGKGTKLRRRTVWQHHSKTHWFCCQPTAGNDKKMKSMTIFKTSQHSFRLKVLQPICTLQRMRLWMSKVPWFAG